MTEALDDPLVRLFAIPFLASLILAGLIRWIGSHGRGEQAAGASIGVIFTWAAAYELGPVMFPPPAEDNNIFYLIAAALLIGVPFDYFRREDSALTRVAEYVLALAFGLAACLWGYGHLDLGALAILLAWGMLTLRLRVVANEDSASASAMLALCALALGVAAWAGGLETNLAFQLSAAAAGYFVLNCLDRTLPFGATLLLGGGGALLLVGLRLTSATPAIIPAIVIAGFILFADTPIRRIFSNRARFGGLLAPFFTCLAAILPIALAAMAAYIGVNFEAN